MTRSVDIDFYIDTDTGAVTIKGYTEPVFFLETPVNAEMGYLDLKQAVKAELVDFSNDLYERG